MGKKFKIEKSDKKEKWYLFKLNSAVLDDDLIKGPHIELFYNNQIVIDGCKGIYEYNNTYLKLRLDKGALVISGNNFDIVTFENNTITVKGRITSLEFCV